MASKISESRNSPLIPQNTGVQLTSGAAVAMCTKLVIVFTVSGNLTVRMADGNSWTLTAMPIGYYTFDINFDTATWTGTATAIGLFTQ
jgi:hypothetical protein